MRTSTVWKRDRTPCDLPITEIVPVSSPYCLLKERIKREVADFCAQYPLSSEGNIDKYIDGVIKTNELKLIKVLPRGKSWTEARSRLHGSLTRISTKTINDVLAFYEQEYMKLLDTKEKEQEEIYYHNVREEFIIEGLRQD